MPSTSSLPGEPLAASLEVPDPQDWSGWAAMSPKPKTLIAEISCYQSPTTKIAPTRAPGWTSQVTASSVGMARGSSMGTGIGKNIDGLYMAPFLPGVKQLSARLLPETAALERKRPRLSPKRTRLVRPKAAAQAPLGSAGWPADPAVHPTVWGRQGRARGPDGGPDRPIWSTCKLDSRSLIPGKCRSRAGLAG
jgi:hypothetical protein